MRLVILFFYSFIYLSANGQGNKMILNLSPTICSYYGEEMAETVTGFKSTDEAETIIGNVLSIVGLKPNFEIRAADVPNAAAVINNGKRFVLYNPKFVEKLNKAAGSKWASVSILAHEIGHHLNGHTLTGTGSRPDIELEADEFSGFVLRKMGASLNDAQIAMKIAADVKSSHTHPGKSDRLLAIAKGWTNANDQMDGKIITPKTDKKIEKPVIVQEPVKEKSALLDEKYIAYDVHFNSDPKTKYYVTVRNNLVKVAGNNLLIAATMVESNKKKYTAMFYDKHYNYLYITANGTIVNGLGKKIGTINKHK
ncbi:MAG: membrane-binding protein [Bacteroidota bacterium]|nr:membrane-binding protein [Bacteroidota bacterium]